MAMNAAAQDLQRLLELQAEDSAIMRLQERRAALPEAQRLDEVREQIAELTSDIEIATKQADEIAREQNRLEGEMEIGDQKIGREEQRLFSGAVANPKELSALQAEVEMLKRKKGELEDQLLEIMVHRDQATQTLDRLRSENERATAEGDELTKKVAALTTEIDTQLTEHTTAREKIATEIDTKILELYEKLRASKGGVGAAALEDGTCGGCHFKLPNKEVERLRAEGGLQRCDNCRRILVVL